MFSHDELTALQAQRDRLRDLRSAGEFAAQPHSADTIARQAWQEQPTLTLPAQQPHRLILCLAGVPGPDLPLLLPQQARLQLQISDQRLERMTGRYYNQLWERYHREIRQAFKQWRELPAVMSGAMTWHLPPEVRERFRRTDAEHVVMEVLCNLLRTEAPQRGDWNTMIACIPSGAPVTFDLSVWEHLDLPDVEMGAFL